MSVLFRNYRTYDINAKLQIARFRPLDVMVVGATGTGKSTTLNAFFQKTVAKVGYGVDPETMKVGDYQLNDVFRIWDTPGLGDSVVQDWAHCQKIRELLAKAYRLDDRIYGWIDMAIVIANSTSRDLGTIFNLMCNELVPNIQRNRIFVILNQADRAMSGRHWNCQTNTPDEILKDFLEKQALSFQQRIYEATGIPILKPVYYSAEYGYNVKAVFDFIIDNMPLQRRTFL